MLRETFIKEGRVNYIIAKPSNGRTPFMKNLINEYESGLLINLKTNKLKDINPRIKAINEGVELEELDLTDIDILFVNHATLLAYYNNSVENVYAQLKILNRLYKTTIICIESYLTFEKNREYLLSKSDRILKLHREYFYTKLNKDKDKLLITIYDNMKNLNENQKIEVFYNGEIVKLK